jgi:DNA-binding NarL/FixJ family response regulator
VKTIFERQSTTLHTTLVPAPRSINSRVRVGLTVREKRVIYLITEGWNDHEIGREFDLSESAVKKFILRICQKLDVSNRVELLFYVLSRWRRHRVPCETNSPVEAQKSSETVNSYMLPLSP